ncbi:MAG: hypothetical protein ACI4NB_10775 [Candidatus Ornithospirochaeta sp.]
MKIKKYSALLLCILMTLPLFSEITEYAKGPHSTQQFDLMLNKSGVNKIYFTECSYDESGNLVQNPISNNRHIFPILGTTATSIPDILCFVWELDDASGATINLKFVSSDSNFETGYMLDDVSSATGLDLNYNVTVFSKNTSTTVGNQITVTNSTVLKSKTLSERTIQVFNYNESDPNDSFVRIEMKVIAPIWEEGGAAAFMDAQYAGYIVAELKFTN